MILFILLDHCVVGSVDSYHCFIIMVYENVVWSHISVNDVVFVQIF